MVILVGHAWLVDNWVRGWIATVMTKRKPCVTITFLAAKLHALSTPPPPPPDLYINMQAFYCLIMTKVQTQLLHETRRQVFQYLKNNP